MLYPNITFRKHEFKKPDGTTYEVPSTFEPDLKEFVEALAGKYPTWEFVETSSYTKWREVLDFATNTKYSEALEEQVRELEVFDAGKEKLGTIGKEGWGQRKLTITNNRIRQQLERGREFKTSDAKKAVKLVDKHFYGKTKAEHLLDDYKIAREAIGDYSREKRYGVNHVWDSMAKSAMEFVAKNFDAYMHMMQTLPTEVQSHNSRLAKFPELLEDYHNSLAFLKGIDDKQAVMVSIKGDEYATVKNNSQLYEAPDLEIDIRERDAIKDHIKRSVGMLKLLEPKQAITGVGLKCTDTIFMVIDKPNNEGVQA